MQMQSINLFFETQLGILVWMYIDNSSSTLRYTHLHMSYYKAQQIAKICFSLLRGMRERKLVSVCFLKKLEQQNKN